LTGSPPYEGARLAILEQARAGRIEPAVQRLRQSGAANELIDLAVACLKPNRTDRPRDASEVVKIVQAHRDTVDLRARAAEIEAAKAKATMAAERRVRSLVVTIAGILILATAAGGALYSLYQYQKRQAAEAQLIADRARLDLERERRERLEASLEILVPLDGKARYMVLEAANVASRDLDRWLHLMGMLREVVNRTAENAPTDDARRKAKELAAQLLECEESLKDRIAKRK
jgi:hypothetical protein